MHSHQMSSSSRHGLVVWAATIRFHIAHIFMNNFDILYNIASQNFPRDYNHIHTD